jgi:hypothetical protein
MANYALDPDTEVLTILADPNSERSDEHDELSEDDEDDEDDDAEEDEDSDEYVDEKVTEQFERQYRQAQTYTLVSRPAPSAPRATVANFHDFGERLARPKTKVATNHREEDVVNIPYRPNQPTLAKVGLPK